MLLSTSFVLGLLGTFSSVNACGDHADGVGHSHTSVRQRRSDTPIPPSPTKDLHWGDINIIHTTDTHGWLLGHSHNSWPEPNYQGTLGDFASFVAGMRDLSHTYGKDLLLVDSGDIHDGTGLTDGGGPQVVDGHAVLDYFKKLEYNVMTVGNHEMYKYDVALDMHKNFAVSPADDRHYISSNAIITIPGDSPGTKVNTTVGERFAKFKTTKGRKVTALGILFTNFTPGNELYLENIKEMVKKPWFQDAVKGEADLFLLAGHMPLATSDDQWDTVVQAIRNAGHPDTPIAILGGHSHIRDCRIPDKNSMGLQSGRYMDTVGWMSIDLAKGNEGPSFTRRYLDPNPVTYEFHSKKSASSFRTTAGNEIDKGLTDLAKKYDLTHRFGVAPEDYTQSQAPLSSENSLYNLYLNKAMPFALKSNRTNPVLNIINRDSLRFDVYAGNFTKNDQIATANYDDEFYAVYDVPYGIASQVLGKLNGPTSPCPTPVRRNVQEDVGKVDAVYREWLEGQSRSREIEGREEEDEKTLGYVTSDRCGPPGSGDDIDHTPLNVYNITKYVQSTAPSGIKNDTLVDMVFLNFIEKNLICSLKSLQKDKNYTVVKDYTPVLSNEVLGVYAAHAWV